MIDFPNAKINLGLNITGRRDDGYHYLQSVMVPVDWHDILEIVPAKGAETSLTVTGRVVDCPVEKNIVMKAVAAMRRVADFPHVDIFLHKVIPDGAGLGGGSSDGAFAIKIINRMFALGLDDATLASVASTVGADCPFFIYNRPMLATGIGTDLSAVDCPLSQKSILIVKPQVSVSTAEAYRGVTVAATKVDISSIIAKMPVSQWQAAGLINDFEASLFPTHPRLQAIKQQLYDLGAQYAAMSGSGSAMFAIFDDDKMADSARLSFPDDSVYCGNFNLF
jgi:4-diphosphocytidyl-2-C-methyl-D-erythritol kinase